MRTDEIQAAYTKAQILLAEWKVEEAVREIDHAKRLQKLDGEELAEIGKKIKSFENTLVWNFVEAFGIGMLIGYGLGYPLVALSLILLGKAMAIIKDRKTA